MPVMGKHIERNFQNQLLSMVLPVSSLVSQEWLRVEYIIHTNICIAIIAYTFMNTHVTLNHIELVNNMLFRQSIIATT